MNTKTPTAKSATEETQIGQRSATNWVAGQLRTHVYSNRCQEEESLTVQSWWKLDFSPVPSDYISLAARPAGHLHSQLSCSHDRWSSAITKGTGRHDSRTSSRSRSRSSQEIWPGRRAQRFKPSADVDLSMPFSAEMPCPGGVCGFRVPLDNRQVHIAALNDEPMARILRNRSTNFAAVLPDGCHTRAIVEPMRDDRTIF